MGSLNQYASRVAHIVGQPDNQSLKERIKDMIKTYFAKYLIQSIDKNGIQPYYKLSIKVPFIHDEETAVYNETYNVWGHMQNGEFVVGINDASNYKYRKHIKYGRLYNRFAALDTAHGGLAPDGWHIPTAAEYQTLIDFVGGNNVSSIEKLAANLTPNVWYLTNPLDIYGFKAIPSGSAYNFGSIVATGLGYAYPLITSTYGNSQQNYSQSIIVCNIYYLNNNVNSITLGDADSKSAYPIRLIKNDNNLEGNIIIDGDVYHSIKIGNQVWLQENLSVKHYNDGTLIASDLGSITGASVPANNNEEYVYFLDNISILAESVISPLYKSYLGYINEFKIPKPLNLKNDSPFTRMSIPNTAKLFTYTNPTEYRIASTLAPTRNVRVYTYENGIIKLKLNPSINNLNTNEIIDEVEVESIWENPEEIIGFYGIDDNQDLELPFPNEMTSFVINEILKTEFGIMPKDDEITKE